MKIKTKLGLSVFSGIAVAGAVTPLVTACGQKTTKINHVHQTDEDKQYGIDANTYSNLKTDYVNKVKQRLADSGLTPEDDEYKATIASLNETLNIFDDKSRSMEMSYGALTSALIDFAKKDFDKTATNGINTGIQLRRTTKAKWTDLDTMFNSSCDAFNLYMDQQGITQPEVREAVMTNARNQFATIKDNLARRGFKENDVYGALVEAKRQVVSCFDLINAEIAKLGAMYVISEFKKNYAIRYKDDTSARLNVLKANHFKTPNEDMTGYINEIFEFVDLETGEVRTFDAKKMAPGYTLTPYFNKIVENIDNNDSKIEINWSAISNNYVQSNDADLARAYQYSQPDNTEVEKLITQNKLKISDINNILVKRPDTTYTNYELKAEMERLQSRYFAEGLIRFEMPLAKDEHARLEPFFLSSTGFRKDEDGATGVLHLQELANTGLQVWNDTKLEYISDIYHRIVEPGFDTSKATLVERMVLYCDIAAAITLESASTHKISLQLYAKYKKSAMPSMDEDNFENWFKVGEPLQCEDYVMSRQQFTEYCIDYSNARDFTDMYFEKKIQKNQKGIKTSMIMASVTLAINGIIAGWEVAMFFLSSRAGFDKPALFLILAAVSVVAISVSSTVLALIVPVNNKCNAFIKKINELLNTPEGKEMKAKMDEGAKYFVRSTNGKLDEAEFETKYEACKRGKQDVFRDLDVYYRNIRSKTLPFNIKAEQLKVSKTYYSQLISDTASSNPRVKAAQILSFLSIPLTLGNIALCGVISVIIPLVAKPAPVPVPVPVPVPPAEAQAASATIVETMDQKLTETGLVFDISVEEEKYRKKLSILYDTFMNNRFIAVLEQYIAAFPDPMTAGVKGVEAFLISFMMDKTDDAWLTNMRAGVRREVNDIIYLGGDLEFAYLATRAVYQNCDGYTYIRSDEDMSKIIPIYPRILPE